jgi:hypothetical protein
MMESDVVMVIWPGVMPGDQIPHTTITHSGDGYRTIVQHNANYLRSTL